MSKTARSRVGRLRRALDWVGRRPLLVLVVPAVLALGAVVLLADLAGAEGLNRAARHVHPLWLLLCLGGELVAYAGYVLAVRDTARVDDGPTLGFGLSTQTVVAGFGVFSATRTTGGFAVDYWALRSAGEDRDGALARVLALGALEYAVLAPAALCSALAGLSILRSLLVAPPREHGLGLFGAAAYWAGDIACLWGALQVFGNPRLSLPALILGYATGYVLTRRSLPAGGAGVVEVALTFALHWVGFPFVRALLGVVVYRLFNLWLPIVPALVVLPAVRELRRELEEAERDLAEPS